MLSRTKWLYKLKKILQNKLNVAKDELLKHKAKITSSCRQDFKDWVTNAVEAMEKAESRRGGKHPSDF